MIGKAILGICIIIAAVIIAKPEYADNGWALAMQMLSIFGAICIVGIVAVVIIVIVILFIVVVLD